MVFNRLKLFLSFKNIWEKLGKLSGHIFSIYKSFSTWSCAKYWTKPPKTISAHFKDLKYFYRKYFHKNPRNIQQVTNAYCYHHAKPSLTIIKFEQVCTTNFLSLIPTFVSMFTWPNEATTPSGASRGIDLLN